MVSLITPCDKELILKRFPRVFDDDSSKPIKFHKAEIVVSKGATPIFAGPYTVAYDQREKVNDELDRLVSTGILKCVKYSDWAAPMVVVNSCA